MFLLMYYNGFYLSIFISWNNIWWIYDKFHKCLRKDGGNMNNKQLKVYYIIRTPWLGEKKLWINQRLFNVDSRISQLKIMIIKHNKANLHCYGPLQSSNLLYMIDWPSNSTMHVDEFLRYHNNKWQSIEKSIYALPYPYANIVPLYITPCTIPTFKQM